MDDFWERKGRRRLGRDMPGRALIDRFIMNTEEAMCFVRRSKILGHHNKYCKDITKRILKSTYPHSMM